MKRNVEFMKKTCNSWTKRGIHGKKREIHGKQRESHEKKRTIHEKNVKFMKKRKNHEKKVEIMEKKVKFMETNVIFMKRNVSPYLHKTAPHHMNRTELTPEPITVSSHPSIPLFPPPLPSSFPFLAGLVCSLSFLPPESVQRPDSHPKSFEPCYLMILA